MFYYHLLIKKLFWPVIGQNRTRLRKLNWMLGDRRWSLPVTSTPLTPLSILTNVFHLAQFIQAFPSVLDHSTILPSIIYFHPLISNPFSIKPSDSTFRKINHELTSLPLFKTFLGSFVTFTDLSGLIKILQFSSGIIPPLVLINKTRNVRLTMFSTPMITQHNCATSK